MINIELMYYFLCHARRVLSFSILPVSNFLKSRAFGQVIS